MLPRPSVLPRRPKENSKRSGIMHMRGIAKHHASGLASGIVKHHASGIAKHHATGTMQKHLIPQQRGNYIWGCIAMQSDCKSVSQEDQRRDLSLTHEF